MSRTAGRFQGTAQSEPTAVGARSSFGKTEAVLWQTAASVQHMNHAAQHGEAARLWAARDCGQPDGRSHCDAL